MPGRSCSKTPRGWPGSGVATSAGAPCATTAVHHFELLKILADHGVPVVVIGGHAVSFHGHIRDTEDLDVIWLRSEAAEAALLAALTAVNAKWISNTVDPATGMEKLVSVSLSYIR